MLASLYHYRAELVRVVDGDTVDLRVDVGFHLTTLRRFRLLGINAPEMRGETLKAARAARECLERLSRDKPLVIRTEKTDAFGRYLAEVWVLGDDGTWTSVANALLTLGYAVPYKEKTP